MIHETSRRDFLGISAAVAGGLFARPPAKPKPCVVVWSEGSAPKKVYPNDINGAIAEGLTKDLPAWEVVKAGIDDPEQGLPDDLLKRCNVLVWWGHVKHGKVDNKLVDRIVKRVREEGMGFLSLHSSHFAKTNKALMGTACSWGAYKGDSLVCKIVVKDASHPIAAGLPKEFSFQHHERYSEPYAVPEPKTVVLDGAHTVKGDKPDDAARMGLCWQLDKGKFFYFQPGHETNPVFMDENVRKVMANAVKWAAP